MCGIAGIRKYGDEPITERQISFLLLSLEHRGNDATGIAMQSRDGEIFVLKSDDAAWRFVNTKDYDKFLKKHLNEDIDQVILHTRAATTGNPRNNVNNHPMYAGKAAAIHNGSIYNHAELFRDLKLERSAETDSDIVRAIVDEHGLTKKAVDVLSKIRGSAAIACLHPEYPGQMLIARSGSPLVVATTEKFVYFASERNAIHRAARPWTKRFGIDACVTSLDIAFCPVANDSAWLLGPEGKEWHAEFKTLLGQYVAPNYSRVRSDYSDRQSKFTREAKTPSIEVLIKCANCNKAWTLTAEQAKQPRSNFICDPQKGGCGFDLGWTKPKELTQ